MVTLKTLPKTTAQEVFDQVVSHLRNQGKQCKSNDDGCVYRNDKGLKCAAGCLIGDDEYYDQFDYPQSGDTTWKSLVREGLVPCTHIELISNLQDIHDHFEPNEWEEKFKKLAMTENLNYKEIV